MKYIIIFAVVLTTSTTFANQLPLSWVSETSNKSSSQNMSDSTGDYFEMIQNQMASGT